MRLNYIKKIFLILFLDLFAYSSIMPLLPILFLDSDFFLQGYKLPQKVIFLGLLFSIYPLAQGLMSPFWAKKADRLGRKAMLQLSFMGNFLGYVVSSYALYQSSYSYLVIGYGCAGCLGVNLSTMNALISDLTQGAQRIRYFGLVNLILGLAFALGPLLSSYLIPKVPHVETVVFFVFLGAACVALINFFVTSAMKEPICFELEPSLLNLKDLKKKAFYPLLVIFLTTFGWYMFIKTFQVFLLESGLYQPAQILKLVAFYGFSTVVTGGLFVIGLYNKLGYKRALVISLAGLCVTLGLFVIQPAYLNLYVNIAAIAFFQSMLTPNLMGWFTRDHNAQVHGQMMSTHLGVVSLAKIVAPIFSGWVMASSSSLSLVLSAVLMLVSLVMLPFLFRHTKKAALDA
jgi:DHA1 family tetracycline resistance protein-like MFS transporter